MAKKRWNRLVLAMLTAALMVSGSAAAASGVNAGEGLNANASAGLKLQCVADQKTAVKGGEIGYHMLYHKVENKNISNAWLKVKVPVGLEVAEAAGAEWDSASQTLQWRLQSLDQQSADALHFQLKVKADAAEDAAFTMTCEGGADGGIQVSASPVTVVLGREMHQPVFDGYPDGRFLPERYLTRAETAAVITRLSNLKEMRTDTVYRDVPAEHWASEYIHKVTEAGYMSGNNGHFHPENPITRGEFVTLMLRVRGVEPLPLKGFTDTLGHWANDAAATAKALGLIEGQDGGTTELDGAVERQMAAKWLSMIYYRGALQDGDVKVIGHWPDVPREHWAFGWVEELSMIAHEGEIQAPMQERLIRYLPDQTEPF